jgi:hypothetical protein
MPYAMPGPQVEPSASYWAGISSLRALSFGKIKDLDIPRHPQSSSTLQREIAFLEFLALPASRTNPALLDPVKLEAAATPKPSAVGLTVRPLSFFLTAPLRPYQGPDAVFVASAPATDDVVRTGMELARYFRSETPSLAHRNAVTYLLHQQQLTDPTRAWSPPRQALVWATLDTAIHSALMAAWYVKWLLREERTSRRERPVEANPKWTSLSDVLNDYAFPAGMPDSAPVPGTTPDIAGPHPSPGTPRHPAYPAAHSTYAAAASTVLAYFFPSRAEDFRDLADNIGVARLWGGVHWPTDHTTGMKIGKQVGEAVLEQIEDIPLAPDHRMTIPSINDLRDEYDDLD